MKLFTLPPIQLSRMSLYQMTVSPHKWDQRFWHSKREGVRCHCWAGFIEDNLFRMNTTNTDSEFKLTQEEYQVVKLHSEAPRLVLSIKKILGIPNWIESTEEDPEPLGTFENDLWNRLIEPTQDYRSLIQAHNKLFNDTLPTPLKVLTKKDFPDEVRKLILFLDNLSKVKTDLTTLDLGRYYFG